LAIKLRPGNAGSNIAARQHRSADRGDHADPAAHRNHLLIRADGAGVTHLSRATGLRKGANLDELVRAGVPVPDGFVIVVTKATKKLANGVLSPQPPPGCSRCR
jgi:hypothetical protein